VQSLENLQFYYPTTHTQEINRKDNNRRHSTPSGDEFILDTPPSPTFTPHLFNPFRNPKEAYIFPDKNTPSDIKSSSPTGRTIHSDTCSEEGDPHEDNIHICTDKINYLRLNEQALSLLNK